LNVKFTPDGLALLFAQAFIFFAALSTGANLVYVVVSMIMALFLLSLILALRGFPGLDARVKVPEEAQEGIAFDYDVILENRGRRPFHLLRVSPVFERHSAEKSLPVYRIDPSEKLSLKGELSLPSRGGYPVCGIKVESVYPTGLLSRQTVLPVSGEVVVVPAPLKHPFPVIPGFNQKASWMETGSSVKGEGTSFYGLKEYVPGDPIRRIHWKATARQGRPMVVETEEDRVNRYYVFIDLREEKQRGEGRSCNLEVSIRIGATLTWQLLKLNCPVRVHLLDAELSRSPQSFTAQDIPKAMRFLGRLSYTRESAFPSAISHLLPDVLPGSFLLFVLPDVDPATLTLLRSLASSAFPLFCLFNLPGLDEVHRVGSLPEVRQIIRSGVHTLFFDGEQERVVTL